MRSAGVVFFAVVLTISKHATAGHQAQASVSQGCVQYYEPPVLDNEIFYHLLFNQLEGRRTNGPANEFRWNGEGWVGTDMNVFG